MFEVKLPSEEFVLRWYSKRTSPKGEIGKVFQDEFTIPFNRLRGLVEILDVGYGEPSAVIDAENKMTSWEYVCGDRLRIVLERRSYLPGTEGNHDILKIISPERQSGMLFAEALGILPS